MTYFARATHARPTFRMKRRRAVRRLGGLLVASLSLAAAQAQDDHGDSAETATLLAISHPATGTIRQASDVDYFRVDLVGSASIDISTSGPTDTRGELFDGTGEMLASNDNSGPQGHNFRIIEQSLEPGVYYVRVSGGPGNYALSARTGTNRDNHGDTAATSTLLPFYGQATIERASPAALLATAGLIQPAGADLDVFRIDIPRGAVDATMRAAGTTDTYARLLDGALDELAADDGGDGNFRIEKRLDAGIYYLEVGGQETATIACWPGVWTIPVPVPARRPRRRITARCPRRRRCCRSVRRKPEH